jgi:hypothetical protein
MNIDAAAEPCHPITDVSATLLISLCTTFVENVEIMRKSTTLEYAKLPILAVEDLTSAPSHVIATVDDWAGTPCRELQLHRSEKKRMQSVFSV